MREPLRCWVAVHGEEANARFVYVTWLMAAKDVRPFAREIGRWRELHVGEPDAHYVYVEWLRAGGDRDAIASSLSLWLSRHATIEEACWPCVAWLRSGGETPLLARALRRWLAVWATYTGASHLYAEWLDHGGALALVAAPIAQWLATHGDAFAASFVLASWLNVGGDPAHVQEHLARWLRRHGERFAAHFVLQAWLRSGGDPALVRGAYMAWIATHDARNPIAWHVRREWSRANETFANGHTARILDGVLSDLPVLARDVGVPERSLRRAVQRGTVRARRPGPRQVELDDRERAYLRENWSLIASISEALRVERNVRLAVLFGSSARGDGGEGSDVDLLVSLARERPLYRVQLAARLARTLARDVDIVDLGHAREREPVLLDQILREGRPIVDRDGVWPVLVADRATVGRAATAARRTRHHRAAHAVAQLVGGS